MRLLPLALLALVACRSELDPGETWAGEEDSFAGVMAFLSRGMRPCTFELDAPELERRVAEACRERGFACYPVGTTDPPTDMHLVFERVIRHRPDVLRVRVTSRHPYESWRWSGIVLHEAGEWRLGGTLRASATDFPRFDEGSVRL